MIVFLNVNTVFSQWYGNHTKYLISVVAIIFMILNAILHLVDILFIISLFILVNFLFRIPFTRGAIVCYFVVWKEIFVSLRVI